MYIAHFFTCKCSVLYLKIRNFIGRLKSAPGENPQKPWKKQISAGLNPGPSCFEVIYSEYTTALPEKKTGNRQHKYKHE